MSFSPLTLFCIEISFVADAALALSCTELPDPSISRDDIYLDACIALNALRDQGKIDDVFFDYLCMHLDYAFSQGGNGGLQ